MSQGQPRACLLKNQIQIILVRPFVDDKDEAREGHRAQQFLDFEHAAGVPFRKTSQIHQDDVGTLRSVFATHAAMCPV